MFKNVPTSHMFFTFNKRHFRPIRKNESCPKSLVMLTTVQSKLKQNARNFFVINFECPISYCNVAEHVSLRMHRGSFKMVWQADVILNNGHLLREMYSHLLSHYKAGDESSLSQIITADETQLHQLEPDKKRSPWNGIIQLLIRRSLRLPLQQGKSELLFLDAVDAEVVILVHITSCGQTINSDLYIQTLKTFRIV
jgi:hypothetical protein